jgi:hypothetical protein
MTESTEKRKLARQRLKRMREHAKLRKLQEQALAARTTSADGSRGKASSSSAGENSKERNARARSMLSSGTFPNSPASPIQPTPQPEISPAFGAKWKS